MGRRRSEKTKPFTENATEGMEEFIEALGECSHDDGQPTTITINIEGKEKDTIHMHINNTGELASFLRLSLKK